jgi:hypothetical protein
MAQIDLAFDHGQSLESAASKLQTAIPVAQSRFAALIRRVDWSDDRHSVLLTGPGFEVRFWVDECKLHAQGRIPLAWKLLEGAARQYVRRAIGYRG